MIEVRLTRHVGLKDGPLGQVEIDLGQCIVEAKTAEKDWTRIGYLGDNARFSPIVSIHESFVEMLKAKLEEASGMPDVFMGFLMAVEE